MLNRTAPDASPDLALTTAEIRVLDSLWADQAAAKQKALSYYRKRGLNCTFPDASITGRLASVMGMDDSVDGRGVIRGS